jgi:hypothetical protein
MRADARLPARLALIALLAVALPARATEGGTGHYLLGSRDILSGIVPPPGVYVSADVIGADASIDRLSIGGAILAAADLDVLLTRLNFTKSFAANVLGGRPMVTVTQPIATGKLRFDGVTPRAALRVEDEQTGLGDTVLTFGLGWDKGPTHLAFQTSVFLPLGLYQRARVNPSTLELRALSFGKNRLGVTPVLALTHLPPTGLELSGALGLSFSTRNTATDYQTAPELHFEGAVAQHFSRWFRLGVAGYAYGQLGEDRGAGADQLRAVLGTSSLKARVFGIGPVVGWTTRLGGASLTLKGKYTHEFEARRRLSGDFLQFSAALGF